MPMIDDPTGSRRAFLHAGLALAGGCAAAAVPPSLVAAGQDGSRNGVLDVTAFGASGRRSENATEACQAAIDACANAGGGTVRVPPGEFSIGTIQLKDNVT